MSAANISLAFHPLSEPAKARMARTRRAAVALRGIFCCSMAIHQDRPHLDQYTAKGVDGSPTRPSSQEGTPMAAAPVHADNSAQADYWNTVAGQRWTAHQERQDQILRPVSDRLIAKARPKPGETVIDIGCGCGATTIAFAARVTPGCDRVRFRARQGRSRGVAVRRYVLRRSGALVRQRAQGPQSRRPARFRLLARGQTESLLHPAAERSGQARPSPAGHGSRGAWTLRLRQ